MSTNEPVSEQTPHEGAWAAPVRSLHVSDVPAGARNLNVDGRQVTSPLQGFGQMWQKTYRARLPGVALPPAEVMRLWKDEFPSFQPAASRFYPSMLGIQPGQIIFIDLKVPPGPGLPSILPVSGGVMVLYVDDVSFTVMTPQGFVVSGFNTFSIEQDDTGIYAQVQSMDRATDPMYELASMFFGAARRQEENWIYVLTALAARLGVTGARVKVQRVCVDPRWQWSEAKNIWHSAFIRTLLYRLAAPLRGIGKDK